MVYTHTSTQERSRDALCFNDLVMYIRKWMSVSQKFKTYADSVAHCLEHLFQEYGQLVV